MLNVSRLIKGSIAALAVVAGGATAMAVVSNGQAPYAATAPEPTNSALQSTANRFRLEFAGAVPHRLYWPPSAAWAELRVWAACPPTDDAAPGVLGAS
jgi:hypothetical protein